MQEEDFEVRGASPRRPAAPPPAPPAGRRGVADCRTGSEIHGVDGAGGGALGPSGTLGAALLALCGVFRASGVLGPSFPPATCGPEEPLPAPSAPSDPGRD